MKKLRKFLLLRPSERRLLLTAMSLLWIARLGLWLIPLPMLRRLLATLRRTKPIFSERDSANTEKIVWAVTLASRCVPAASCLTQALVGHTLLARYGEPALLRIGVAKNEAGKLEAHAWLESQGRIVIGASPELFRYTLLPSLEGKLL